MNADIIYVHLVGICNFGSSFYNTIERVEEICNADNLILSH